MNRNFFTTTLCVLFFHVSANAVVVNTPIDGNAATHTSAPANGAPWDNVIRVNTGSGVYLGGGWVLTAKHVFDSGIARVDHVWVDDQGNTHIDRYSSDNNNILDFETEGLSPGDSSVEADLRLFRLDRAIGRLPSLEIASTGLNDAVTMIGRGGGKSWGTNEVAKISDRFESAAGRITRSFETHYNSTIPGEAQGTSGDSGGGVFREIDGKWYIVGTINSIYSDGVSQYTANANLGRYQTEIESFMAIPEPSSGLFLGVMLLSYICRKKRQN